MIHSCVLDKIQKRCGYDNGLCISSNVVSYSHNHVAVDVCDHDGQPKWRAVGIYGWAETANKHKTWALMNQLKNACSLPFVIFGDFNEITSLAEKEGGAIRSERQMDSFRKAIDDCCLRDLGYKGSIFTWTCVRERLDRFFADDGWCNIYPFYEVIHFPIYKSDHALICLNVNTTN
ncbi:Thymidylate kinase [Bienertia sinuspersici]